MTQWRDDTFPMYTYTIPNGARVDAERLVDAALAAEEYPQVYLDTATGKLVEIHSMEALRNWVAEIGNLKRYVLIERFDDTERNAIAREFIDGLLKDMVLPDETTGARNALESGGWQQMEVFLKEHTDGWIHGWHQYIGDEAWEYVHDWLTKNPYISIRVGFEGCEDCALCELLRKGEGSDLSKTMKVFAIENALQNTWKQLEKKTKGKKTKKKTMQSSKVFVFKVTLNDYAPRVWRRIIVPSDYTFFDLHCAIQNAMGWADAHLHAFRIDTRSQTKTKRNKLRQSDIISIKFPNRKMDDFEDSETRDERVEHIADWFGVRMSQCVYDYDFGDNWTHTVLFEKEIHGEEGAIYPQCVAGKGACPPEDCGGVWGYRELQDILKKAGRAEHTEMLEWLGLESAEEFDPVHFDPKEVEFDDPKERLREYEKGFGIQSL